ncbi:MAG: galactokinase [Terrimicrobiaceae bacterium]|nr:galactokinase [Terrimicrobiaceae bacterium]
MLSAFAPGRIELLGNHTDYNEGVVLSAAIDLGVTVAGERLADGRISLASAGFEPAEIAPGQPLLRTGTWMDYPLGVVAMLRADGAGVGGFRAEFSSTLPVGSGLSSSAAMEVATAVFLRDLFGLQLPALEIAKLGRRAENDFVGVGCGLLDQVSSVFGRRQHAIFLDCRTETVERIPFPAGVDLLVVQSGVAHALTGGEYDERRAQCFEAARRLGVPALRDVTSAGLSSAPDLPDVVRRRAAHIVGENERVLEAVGFLRAGNIAAFGRLMAASHESSRVNFENSTPELDLLVEIALRQPGVHGARLTGGGFGGAIVAAVDSQVVDGVGNEIVLEYEKRTGIETRITHCRIGDGAVPDA